MRRLSHLVATVTGVAMLSLAAGCGGDNPAPSAAPSGTPSRSVTQPADTAAPTPAPEIRKRSREGAVAAVKYFLESLNFAGQTGDTAAMRKAYIEYCTRCEAIADGIDATYRKGGQIRGGEWLPRRFKFYAEQGGIAYVDAVVDYTPQTWQRSSDAEAESVASQRNVLKAFNLRWRGQQGWTVSALDPDA